MEETVAIRRNRIRVRRGLLAVFGAAAFLLLMNVHTAYGAGD